MFGVSGIISEYIKEYFAWGHWPFKERLLLQGLTELRAYR